MTRLPIIVFLVCLSSASFAGDLVPAFRRGNTRELLRLGQQLGADGLADEILGDNRPLAIASVHASLGARDAFALLGHLAVAAMRPDRSLALVAVEAAAEIAQRCDPAFLEQEEISDAQLLEWYAAWIVIASDTQRWVDIRIYAFETATRLHELVTPRKRPVLDLSALLAEEEAELRAAVLALSPPHLHIEARALTLLEKDVSDAVALRAAQVFCGPLGLVSERELTLNEASAVRVIRLAADPMWDIAARADLAPCLAANPSKESLRTLAVLTQESPPMLRQSLLLLSRAR